MEAPDAAPRRGSGSGLSALSLPSDSAEVPRGRRSARRAAANAATRAGQLATSSIHSETSTLYPRSGKVRLATSASAWSPASAPLGSGVEDAPRLKRFSSGQGRPALVKKPSASRGAPHHSRFPPGPRSITLSIALNALGDGWCTEKITTRPRPC